MAELQWGVFQADLNPVRGSEQAGTRPVLVVSRESIHRSISVVGICPLTSLKPGRKIYSTEVLLPRGCAGLSLDSLVLGHQVRTVSKQRLSHRLGTLIDPALREDVKRCLALFLGIDI